ncbi:MAG: HAD family hydrolase, partial [Candidatus Micrarchaeia archaeon]
GLSGPHIADNGGIIVDLLARRAISKTPIDLLLARGIVSAAIENNTYVEAHDGADYFIQAGAFDAAFVKKREAIMHKEPVIVDSIIDVVKKTELTKIIAFAKDDSDKPRVEGILEPFLGGVSFKWNYVPVTNPVRYGIVTAKGISKGSAVEKVSKVTGKTLDNALGIGDGVMDWDFISKCGHGCAMGNAVPSLKELVKSKGDGRYMIAPHVDDHGVIDAFRHFGILK